MKKTTINLCLLSTVCLLTANTAFADYYQCKDKVVKKEKHNPGPLRPGAFSIQLKGGIAPAFYTHRGPVWLTVPALAPSVVTSTYTARFSDQFHMPWEVGMELGVNVGRHSEFFLEGFYQQAAGKTYDFIGAGANISEVLSNYKNPALYLGARYYFHRFDCGFSPFLGFKGGAAWQGQVDYQISYNGTYVATNPYFFSQWAPSAGIQAGFDWLLVKHVSLVFTGEAVATAGMKNNRNVIFADPAVIGGITNVNIGETGKVISFPVTIGFKFTF